MKHFTITPDNNIAIYSSRKAAKETGLPVFSNEEQLADLIAEDAKRLVEVYNSIPGTKPVTKFSNRKVGLGRIWAAIQGLTAVADAASAVTHAPTEVQTHFDEIEPAAGQTTTEVASSAPLSPAPAEILDPGGAQAPDTAPEVGEATAKHARRKRAAKGTDAVAAKAKGTREGSKTATVLGLLQREGGASATELLLVTGWLPHSLRGFLSGTLGKKMGLAVSSTKGADGERRYSIPASDAICG